MHTIGKNPIDKPQAVQPLHLKCRKLGPSEQVRCNRTVEGHVVTEGETLIHAGKQEMLAN